MPSPSAWRAWPAALAAAAALGALAAPPAAAQEPKKVPVAVLSLADDPRYDARRMERAYPGHPTGRAIDGVRLAAEDSAIELDASGLALDVQDMVLPSAAALPEALQKLKSAKVHYVIADLPLPALRQLVKDAPAALGTAIVFNTGLDHDSLRGEGCAPHLLHTYPSRRMLADATAQYLAARGWKKTLVLHGPRPEDEQQLQAFNRAAKRFGLNIVKQRPFKLTGDPRERELANPRLLTSGVEHDTVTVLDSDGEFARTLPYATQLPRPVTGANGLVATVWHPQWERFGGPNVSRRFAKQTKRPMTGHDWAAWAAARMIAITLANAPQASQADQLKSLRSGQTTLDGAKGVPLSFRPWDGQMRQPIMLSHSDGVAGSAPLDGVLHPVNVLDTLGTDRQESTCKERA
ncbi:MAG: branched-chain amino acid ABC transporter substrate-binding protein [Pseudomonadota bacterium]|nr:branched-chain amino acid ABC transporter substrate-binding protein [Pseudomonadota bacterium]